MSSICLNYQQFLAGYNKGDFVVFVNKSKAGDFVLSEFAHKHNKPAHLFWTWLGIIMIIAIPIVLLFLRKWIYAAACVTIGIIINNAARKSACRFVLQNMLESEDFWDYVLLHKGASIKDNEGREVTSEYLDRMARRFEGPQ